MYLTMITLYIQCKYTIGLRVYVIILLVLYACSFMESVMSTHIADRIYQNLTKYVEKLTNY